MDRTPSIRLNRADGSGGVTVTSDDDERGRLGEGGDDERTAMTRGRR